MDVNSPRRREAFDPSAPSADAAPAATADGESVRHDDAADAHEGVAHPPDDGAALRFLRARSPRLGDGVLYVGMNSDGSQNAREAAALRASGPGVRRTVGHGETQPGVGADRVHLANGAVVDLATPEGADSFAASLGLSRARAAEIARIVHAAESGSRDELAQIAAVFAEAERGGDIPSRLVLSGHSMGITAYDGAGRLGALHFQDVLALADAMPRAAAQIEDIMLSACSTGFDDQPDKTPLRAWKEHFPNLKTAWGYGRSADVHSPTGDGALKHVKAWELATRGRQEKLSPRADIARANDGPVGHERNVSIWTVAQGYVQGGSAAASKPIR